MDFLYFLQNNRTDFWDGFFSVITYFGSEILTILVMCLLFWCLNKRTAYKLCSIYFVSGIAIQGLKIVCRIERPWILDKRLTPVESAVDAATGYSFPSGHTQNITALSGSLAVHIKKILVYIAAFILTALVMLSRMYLGCHTPKDVLVSFAVTLFIVIIVNFVFEKFVREEKHYNIIFILAAIISVLLIAYSFYVVQTGKSTTALTLDCFKAAGVSLGFAIGGFIENNYIHYDPKCTKSALSQAIKLVVGLVATLLIKEGIKMAFGESIVVSIIRYAVIALWIMAIYPAILKRICRR